MNMIIVWAVLIVFFAVAEALTAQLVSIWFVIGSVGALIATLLNASVVVQIGVFLIISIVALIITRPLVNKLIKPKIESTNADRCIGSEALVTKTISNIDAKGQVKVGGKEWSAISLNNSTIKEGEIVIVERIDGVKLIVKEKVKVTE